MWPRGAAGGLAFSYCQFEGTRLKKNLPPSPFKHRWVEIASAKQLGEKKRQGRLSSRPSLLKQEFSQKLQVHLGPAGGSGTLALRYSDYSRCGET